MARRINEIELIQLAVFPLVVEAHRLGLDGYAALPLQIHIVEDLRLHLTLRECPRIFNQTIRNRRFAMINMSNNREIADIFVLHSHFPFKITIHIYRIIALNTAHLQEIAGRTKENYCFLFFHML